MDLILKYSGTTIYKEITYWNVDFIPRKGDSVYFEPLSRYMQIKDIGVDYSFSDGKSTAQITAKLDTYA